MEHQTVVIKTNIYMTDIDEELKKSDMRIGWIGELINTRTNGDTQLCDVVVPILRKSDIVDSIKLILPRKYISFNALQKEVALKKDGDNVSAIALDDVDSFIMTVKPKGEELELIYKHGFYLTDFDIGKRYVFERL